MAVSKEIQEKVARELRKDLPLMDIDKTREEFLAWLEDLKFPGREDAQSWEECLTVIPRPSDNKDLEDGVKLRFALSFYTARNKYLISILESFDPDSRGTYILAVHTNFDETEKRIMKRIENEYLEDSDDGLQARHTIWAQTFQEGELAPALDAAAKAILGQELTEKMEAPPQGKTLSHPNYSTPLFAQPSDDENIVY